MNVLVTRARADAERTAARLAMAGHAAIVSPLIEIVGTDATLPEAPVDAILATSVHALHGIGRLPAALAGAPWRVVGERLASALRARSFQEAEAVATDVAGMIAAIAARYPEPSRFLYLAGRDRKPDLERALASAGHAVTSVETYRARALLQLEPAAETAMRDVAIGAVLHFSRRSAELFVAAMLRADLDARTCQHIAISADVAAPLAVREWPCRVARSPDEEAMVAALLLVQA